MTPSCNKTSRTVPPREWAAAAIIKKPSPLDKSAAWMCARAPSDCAISFKASSPILNNAECSLPAQLRSSKKRRTRVAFSSTGSKCIESRGGFEASPYLNALLSILSRMMLKRTLSNRSSLRNAAAPVVSDRKNGEFAAEKRCLRKSTNAAGSTASKAAKYLREERRIKAVLLVKTSAISSICPCKACSAHDCPNTMMRFLSSWFK
mmetsp:Transcript_24763/g.88458  ORF Transcript_24763/g.88458 Transcript_24763/m.88458 type:complete len:206 (+) Transcript_24763:440-1057(+)